MTRGAPRLKLCYDTSIIMAERTTVVLPEPLKQRAVADCAPRGTARKKTGDPFWGNLKFYEGGAADVAELHDEYLYGKD